MAQALAMPWGATLPGGAAFGAGRTGNAVRLDGVDDHATTDGVDVRTSADFTVSAWIRLETKTCATTRCLVSAVSLDGGTTQHSKFRLGYVIDDDNYPSGNWIFEMTEPNGTVTEAAIAVRPGETEQWVHLTGVYSAGARAISLYVNGSYAEDGTLVGPWDGTGALRIGAGLRAGQPTGFWHGSVDDVRLYTGALNDARITALYRAYPPEKTTATLPVADAGHWKLDDGTGTTAADASGAGRTATVRGATWGGGRDLGSLMFDGTGGHAETAGPVLDTTGSFSVSAWVNLTDTTKYAAAFGQDGTSVSTFYVQHDAAAKKWGVVVPRTDDAAPVLDQVLSTEPALPWTWTHLTVVYDSITTQLRLYVNGAPSGVKVGIRPRPSTGPLTIGRCKWNGAKGCFFPKGVDDVRAFGKALSDAEVRRVHDAAPPSAHGSWRFDDSTVRDSSWRANPTTTTGTVTYPAGLSGPALGLDGVSAAATATNAGIPMRTSFTVSAWAKLSRLDKHAVVLGQDGVQQSGFTIQYRPEVNRWMFGQATHDADGAPTLYVPSLNPPVVNTWTHLTGVYDHAGRQLRIYVDGQLVGIRDNVQLWQATGGFTIGRGKVDGAPAGFFPGHLDDVTTDLGVVPDADIAQRGTRALPTGGQVGRFLHTGGDRRSINAATGIWDAFSPVPADYRFEGPLGMTVPEGTPGAHPLYSCQAGADSFTSKDPGCGGAVKLGDFGWVYTEPPAGVRTVPLNACRIGGDRADSVDTACEGGTVEAALGHLVAYAPLTRYVDGRRGDHAASTGAVPPGYRWEGALGLLARSPTEPGIVLLRSCRDGTDLFLSTDPACGGKVVGGVLGGIWPEPPTGLPSTALYQCRTSPTNHFASTDAACEGLTVVGRLGYVLTGVPGA
ncbi:hypothetical protein GCM10023148_08170 [Actinokineospora soli]